MTWIRRPKRIAVKRWMVYGARALALLWAGAAVLLLFVILALVHWRWDAAGGLLLVAGILFLIHHRSVTARA